MSIPENGPPNIENVYDDYFVLDLADVEIDFVLSVYDWKLNENVTKATLLIKNNLHRGQAIREG